MDIKYSLILATLLLLLLINNTYSLEEDQNIYNIFCFLLHLHLSEPNFKYEENSEKIEYIITEEQSIKIPQTKLIREGFYFNGWTTDFIYRYKPGEFFY